MKTKKNDVSLLRQTGRFFRGGISLVAGVAIAVVVQAVLGSLFDNL